jgi:hypothetical protein
MSRNLLLLAIITIVFVSIACSFTINIPEIRLRTGETITDEVVVQAFDDQETAVNIEIVFGAGKLKLFPGAENALVRGTATYNATELKPELTISDNKVQIKQGQADRYSTIGTNTKNEWELALGTSPLVLSITAGAYTGEFDLGGLSLEELKVREGASDTELVFSIPNLIEMRSLVYETGASSTKLLNLANANFERMEFKGGVGSYTLDFSGELLRDAIVEIDAGLSNLVIAVPRGVPTQLTVEGSLTNISTAGDWQRSDDSYVLSGDGPKITFEIKLGAGNLELINP